MEVHPSGVRRVEGSINEAFILPSVCPKIEKAIERAGINRMKLEIFYVAFFINR